MFGLEPDISLTDSRVKLSPPLSLPDLIRQSRDSPVEPGNDEKEKKPGNDSIIFFPLLPSGVSRGLWIAVCKFPTTLGPFRSVSLEFRL